MAEWTIKIGGASRTYKKITLNRKIDKASPTKFSATVKYYSGLSFFDLVEIKRNGTTEWKGFVEEIDVEWDDEGKYYSLSGRDITLILWKKYAENYSNMHENTAGFFGSVNINE